MKIFLLANPKNRKYVEAQEKRHKYHSNIEDFSSLVCHEMFPNINMERIELSGINLLVPSSYSIPNKNVIEAHQRQLGSHLTKDILSDFTSVHTSN